MTGAGVSATFGRSRLSANFNSAAKFGAADKTATHTHFVYANKNRACRHRACCEAVTSPEFEHTTREHPKLTSLSLSKYSRAPEGWQHIFMEMYTKCGSWNFWHSWFWCSRGNSSNRAWTFFERGCVKITRKISFTKKQASKYFLAW
jgi:hypothetical protein